MSVPSLAQQTNKQKRRYALKYKKVYCKRSTTAIIWKP
jgi:hypothetical protein